MISLKKYLDAARTGDSAESSKDGQELLSNALAAYRSALNEMGNCSILDACPGLGKDLKQNLHKLGVKLALDVSSEAIDATEMAVREKLQDWGGRAATHYQQKAGEVKEILLVLARTAESVGARDQRCAQQIDEVTARLQSIANLDDLTQIRASIEEERGRSEDIDRQDGRRREGCDRSASR